MGIVHLRESGEMARGFPDPTQYMLDPVNPVCVGTLPSFSGHVVSSSDVAAIGHVVASGHVVVSRHVVAITGLCNPSDQFLGYTIICNDQNII